MDFWIGHRHHDQEVRHGSVGCEPLVPVDDPLLAVPDSRCLQQRWIRSGGVGLGHREGRAQTPSKSGCNHCDRCDSSPLISIPTASNSAFPSRAHCCRTRVAPAATAPGSRASAPAAPAEPHAAQRRRQVRRPQPLCLHPLLQRPHHDPHLVVRQIQVSSGNTSSRTKSRIHSNFSSNSGSVEKSQAMTTPPSAPPNFRRPTPCHYRGRRDHHEPRRLPLRSRCPAPPPPPQVALSAADRAVIAGAEQPFSTSVASWRRTSFQPSPPSPMGR